MTLRIGWLSPFTFKTGVGTFSKAITDAMPECFAGEPIDLTVIMPPANQPYRTRHRVIDITSTSVGSGFYDLFDVLVYNIGNNREYHAYIVETLRHNPGIVICHDYVYQHFLADHIQHKSGDFSDYVALTARYGSAEALRAVRQSNVTGRSGLRFGPWDAELSATEPLAAPILHLGAALVVHSGFAETYARDHFSGPVLKLGLPYDQRPVVGARDAKDHDRGHRIKLVSFGYIQSTKCIHDMLLAIAGSTQLRAELTYTIAGFAGDVAYADRLQALVREHGLHTCVRFAFDLSDEELADISDQADAFINLRYPNTEGASVSLIEQLDTGKPVVVIDSGCYAEVPADAAFKVARPNDVPALRQAILDLLASRSKFDEIGSRGRAYARRYDCAGYARGLLELIHQERGLIGRRALEKAASTIEWTSPPPEQHPDDEIWSEALGTSRTSFDLIDQGRLAPSPAIFRELAPQALVDYVQATLVRDGRNFGAQQALHDYLLDKSDPYVAVRILELARELAGQPNTETIALFTQMCPRGEIAFWSAVAILGVEALEAAAHQAFFDSPPVTRLFPGPSSGRDMALQHAAIANELASRDRAKPARAGHEFGLLLSWLRREHWINITKALCPLVKGRTIAIGSPGWDSYVNLRGFYDPEPDHAWSSHQGLILARLPPQPGRVLVFGHGLDATASSVQFAVNVGTVFHPASRAQKSDGPAYELDIPSPSDAESIVINISASPCFSPADLGPSSDGRPLGFCLRQVSLM